MQYSIVHLSEVKRVFDWRIDAEYWQPAFIKNSQLVSAQKRIKDFTTRDISNIKSKPIKRNFDYLEISKIPLNSFGYETAQIQKGEEPDRAHYILRKNDVAVSTVRPNRNAVAFIKKDGIIGSSGLSVLRAQSIEPEYLFAFCKTNYFIQSLLRANKATMYPAISNKDILDMPLFIPSENFREKIKQSIQKAVSYIAKSKALFAEAQSLLLSELGLSDYQPKHHLTFIKQLSDVEEAGRMDAEYFQPKYEEIIKKIKNYKGGSDTIGNLVKMEKGIEVGKKEYSEKGVPFVRVSNLHLQEIAEEKYISKQLYSEVIKHQPQEGEILLTKDATPGIAHYLQNQPKKMIVSSGILRLKNKQEDKVNNNYLTLFLNSMITKEQINRDVGGSIILHWLPDQVKQTQIPLLLKEKQMQIQKLVTESLSLHKQSKKLLENSKYAVETAIEKDEKTALHWLKNEF